MKEELEKLGFVYDEFLEVYDLNVKDLKIRVKSYYDKHVYLTTIDNFIFLFPYNHEKLKQLIKLLS